MAMLSLTTHHGRERGSGLSYTVSRAQNDEIRNRVVGSVFGMLPVM